MPYRGKPYDYQMTAQERGRGWVFFALYVLVLPFLMGVVQRSAEGALPVAEANLVYYLLCAATAFLLFGGYLRDAFSLLLDNIRRSLFALATGLAGVILLQTAVLLIPYPVDNPNRFSYPEQFALAPGATAAIVVVLMPVVEEILFRGLLFGSLRQFSRPLAWAASALAYAVYAVWQFAFTSEGADGRYLLLSLQYIPVGLGTAWCYDRGGSIWTAVLLRMAVGGLALYVLTAGL